MTPTVSSEDREPERMTRSQDLDLEVTLVKGYGCRTADRILACSVVTAMWGATTGQIVRGKSNPSPSQRRAETRAGTQGLVGRVRLLTRL